MKKLEELFGKELVESWGKEIPDYAKRVQKINKDNIEGYQKIGWLKHYDSSWEEESKAQNRRMGVYYSAKENCLYGAYSFDTRICYMIVLNSINVKNGIADTNDSISKTVRLSEMSGGNTEFMKDFCCKKDESIPYQVKKMVETYTIYELKKEGGKGEFIAKGFSHNDAIRIMKNAEKEGYIVYMNGEPNVFYKEDLI